MPSKAQAVPTDDGIEIVPTTSCGAMLSEEFFSVMNFCSFGGNDDKDEVQMTEEEGAVNWKSVIDPNTGCTYYYHLKTRVTTWTKPDGFEEEREEESMPRDGSMSRDETMSRDAKENSYWIC